jgi:hypothetical protein
MTFLLPLVAGCALLPAADPAKPAPLRYLRPHKDGYVLESEVATTSSDDGTVVTSRSERPGETMTLTLHYDRAGKLTRAEAVQGGTKKVVTLELGEKGTGTMKRGGLTDLLKDLPADPIVTTAPDWTDVFQLVRRYDAAKGGKQEFAGLWFHPVQGLETQTFTIERQGQDAVTVKSMEVKLTRYRIKLRSGDCAAWADGEGRVLRLQPLAAKATPVVLEGFEDATKGLKP